MSDYNFKSLHNVNLVVMPNVILSVTADEGIFILDSFYKEAGLQRYITSVLRDSVNQLDVIISYCTKYRIKAPFTKYNVDVMLPTGEHIWRESWSRLLVAGLIINPPLRCSCKYDHTNCEGVFIPSGTVYEKTPHVTGFCADTSIWRGNQIANTANNVDQEIAVVKKAMIVYPKLIVKYVVERSNSCLHTQFDPAFVA